MLFNNRNWFQRQAGRIITRTERYLSQTGDHCLICQGPLFSQRTTSIRKPNQPPKVHIRDICQTCQAAIPWIDRILCHDCGRYETCYDCRRRERQYYVFNRSAVRYDAMMKHWLSEFKYRKNERIAPLLIKMMLPTFSQLKRALESNGQAIDGMTYIPLSQQRMEERGFNQAEMLARGLAHASGLRLIPLLGRTRHTHKQSYKDRAARMRGLGNIFHCHDVVLTQYLRYFADHIDQGTKLNLVLVDDVFTTGSTLNEAAKTITSHLPCDIYGITWAR